MSLTEVSKSKNLPIIKTKGKYDSEKEYLDTYFRLMREECFYKLKKGISDFVNGKALDDRNMMMYRYSL